MYSMQNRLCRIHTHSYTPVRTGIHQHGYIYVLPVLEFIDLSVSIETSEVRRNGLSHPVQSSKG